MARMTAREVCSLVGLLGHDELEAVGRALRRITAGGRDQYGNLVVATDPRNFVHEALSEALDGFFYLAVASLRIEESARLGNPGASGDGVTSDPHGDVDPPESWPEGSKP